MTFYSKEYDSLDVYITIKFAADHDRVEGLIHTHSEYETKWDQKENEWIKKGYYEVGPHIERFKGTESIIIKLRFMYYNKDKICEFIKEIDDYFEQYHTTDYVRYIKFGNIKDIENY